MDVFPKFIIEDDKIIIGKVNMHQQLVTDKTKVRGGGWFKFISDTNTFQFYGDSNDFGKATLEDIKSCVDNNQIFEGRGAMYDISDDANFSYHTGSEEIILKRV